jgi:TonB family protein
MNFGFAVALCAAALTLCESAVAQDSSRMAQAAPIHEAERQSGLVGSTIQVYRLGKDATAPELIPIDYSAALGSDCERTEQVKTELKYIVDTSGLPHEIQLNEEIDGNTAQLLLQWMQTVRFKPAQQNGAPIAVGISDRISVEVCYEKVTDAAGKTGRQLRLHSAPVHELESWKDAPKEVTIYSAAPNSQSGAKVERIGGATKAPVPVHTIDPPFSEEAKRKHIKGGVCMVQIIVDEHGVPQDPRIVKALGYGLDEMALESVKQYRFKPATKDGKPVPVYMTIAINFQLY